MTALATANKLELNAETCQLPSRPPAGSARKWATHPRPRSCWTRAPRSAEHDGEWSGVVEDRLYPPPRFHPATWPLGLQNVSTAQRHSLMCGVVVHLHLLQVSLG